MSSTEGSASRCSSPLSCASCEKADLGTDSPHEDWVKNSSINDKHLAYKGAECCTANWHGAMLSMDKMCRTPRSRALYFLEQFIVQAELSCMLFFARDRSMPEAKSGGDAYWVSALGR